MYCSKCGAENLDNAQFCLKCGQSLASVSPAATPMMGAETAVKQGPVKTSGLAITSFVLGLLSFCTFFLTTLPAIVLGIIALVVISKNKGRLKGTGLAIAGIAVPVALVPVLAVMMAIAMPALSKVRLEAQKIACSANISQLGNAMQMYASDNNDVYPTAEKWCDLLAANENVDENVFRCLGAITKGGRCNYAMNVNAEKAGIKGSPEMVLLFESKPGWNQAGGAELLTTENHVGEGCNVVFNDGAVEFVKTEDLNDLKWKEE